MDTIALEAIDGAVRLGASYADARAIRSREQHVRTRDGGVEAVVESEDAGLGVRVLVDGAWGFAAGSGLNRERGVAAAVQAVQAARAAASVNTVPVELAPNRPVVDSFVTPLQRDPFTVPVEERIHLLLEAERLLRVSSRTRVTRASCSAFWTDKFFCSSEGARISQQITECGGGVYVLAAGEGAPAVRSENNYAQAGWEYVDGLGLATWATRLGAEADQLLDAPYVEPKMTDVVLGSSLLALMVHETCGHPTELDRVLGFEDAFAGGSFLRPQELGELRYGSEHVNLWADSTLPLGLGTFGYDDDGVPAQRFPLVREGIFCGYLSSRETAPLIGLERSTACARADGWARMPIVRMVNVSLEAGDTPVEALIGDVEDGLLLDVPASWSLDDKRLNFHFGTQIGHEIKGGRVGGLRRGASLQAITPEFWSCCDGIADNASWTLWGLLSCAKGEPLQSLHVGHGAAPARFRDVHVGVER